MATQTQLGSGGGPCREQLWPLKGWRWDAQGWMGVGWGSASSPHPSTVPKSLRASSSLTHHCLPPSPRAFILPSVATSSPSSFSPSPKSPSPHRAKLPSGRYGLAQRCELLPFPGEEEGQGQPTQG